MSVNRVVLTLDVWLRVGFLLSVCVCGRSPRLLNNRRRGVPLLLCLELVPDQIGLQADWAPSSESCWNANNSVSVFLSGCEDEER